MDFVNKISLFIKAKDWMVNMFWIFRNPSKVRLLSEKAITSPPFCPAHEARMIFKKEVVYVERSIRIENTFKRNYKCPLCDYEMYTIYTAKKD